MQTVGPTDERASHFSDGSECLSQDRPDLKVQCVAWWLKSNENGSPEGRGPSAGCVGMAGFGRTP